MSWEHATAHLNDSQRGQIARDAARRRWERTNAEKINTLDDATRTIVAARVSRCMSQSGAAREMGIASVTLHRIESSNRNVGSEYLAKAIAWATAAHDRDGLLEQRERSPKPRYQRPLPSDPQPRRVPVFVAEPAPLPPRMLLSGACPYWSRWQVSITEAACAWTATQLPGICEDCAGILALAAQ